MNLKNIVALTILGAAWLTVATLMVVVSPGAIVAGFALPAVTSAALSEVD